MREARTQTLVQRIEDDIFLGHLAPGAWLKQVDLERDYGCSRIALRQALDTVAHRGMLRHHPNRGYHVDRFEEGRIRQVAEARAVLEVAAAEALLPLVTPDHLAELKELARLCVDAAEHATEIEMEGANKRFHDVLLRPCPNRVIVDLTMELRRRIPLAAIRRHNTPSRVRARVQEHFGMIDALRQGDREALVSITRRHILD